MTRNSFDPSGGEFRTIPADMLPGSNPFALNPLEGAAAPVRSLSVRDLNNETARAAFELGRRRGFQQGSQMGLRQGFSEGSQALDEFQSRKAADVAQHMQLLVSSFQDEMTLLESQLASDLVSLAVDIARQVLRRELATDTAALVPVAAEALRALGEGASRLEVRTHPNDAAALRPHLEKMAGDRAWHLLDDSSITRGGCRVEADTGVADASFEARWQAVMSALGREEEPGP